MVRMAHGLQSRPGQALQGPRRTGNKADAYADDDSLLRHGGDAVSPPPLAIPPSLGHRPSLSREARRLRSGELARGMAAPLGREVATPGADEGVAHGRLSFAPPRAGSPSRRAARATRSGA